MIAIVDYGMGNLRSVYKAFENQGFKALVTSDTDVIRGAQGLVLPGVGAFGACIRNLEKHGLKDAILAFIDSGRPFLGICLGLQVLFEKSEESPGYRGLGVISGRVVRFPDFDDLKVPHMGWNQLSFDTKPSVMKDIPDRSWFYFVHSYYVCPEQNDINTVTTEYGFPFTAAVEKGNIFASQFHPEKSSNAGLGILRNFGEICSSGAGHCG